LAPSSPSSSSSNSTANISCFTYSDWLAEA
jgi:hypothetical protein